MFAYLDNKLNPKERHLVEKHLLDCELCSDAMDGLEMLGDRNRIKVIKELATERLSGANKGAKVFTLNVRVFTSIAASIILLIGSVFFFKVFVSNDMMEEKVAKLDETSDQSPSSPSSGTEAIESETNQISSAFKTDSVSVQPDEKPSDEISIYGSNNNRADGNKNEETTINGYAETTKEQSGKDMYDQKNADDHTKPVLLENAGVQEADKLKEAEKPSVTTMETSPVFSAVSKNPASDKVIREEKNTSNEKFRLKA